MNPPSRTLEESRCGFSLFKSQLVINDKKGFKVFKAANSGRIACVCMERAGAPGPARHGLPAGARCGGGRQTGLVFTLAVVATTVFWGWIFLYQVVLVGCCPLSCSLLHYGPKI